ncbi:MAG: thioredoxin [Acidobacteria bacterium]|nr:thioredoxin [Acidobacteriota bacterium]
MSDHTVELTDSNFETEVLQSKIPVLVDFWASWCRPCIMLAPTVEALAQDYNGRAKVGKLNVDENMGVAGKYKIQGIPALLLFKEGEVRDQIVGAQSKDNIQAMLDRNL